MRTYGVLYITGAAAYMCVELLWRQKTHISMFFTGGLCALLLYGLCGLNCPLALLLLGGVGITAIEYTVGFIVNKRMKLGVWDYSDQKFNRDGQICALYSMFWLLLTLPAAAALRYIADKL